MNIWVPKGKILEPKRALLLPTRVQGIWRSLEAVRPDGRRRHLAGPFPNLITDAGLNYMGSAGSWMAACRVGTGNATPNVTDTALQSQVGGTTTTQGSSNGNSGAPPYYGYSIKTYRFGVGVAAGNLAEIGIATQAAAGGTLWSRALILDGDGDPTTITVQADEFLDATYEIRVVAPADDVPDVLNISGTDYDLVVRACDVNNSQWSPQGGFQVGSTAGVKSASVFSGAVGAVTGNPSGTSASGSGSEASYGNNNLYRENTMTWGLNSANFGGGILSSKWQLGSTTGAGGFGNSQCSFTPAIMKTSSQILTLVYRHTWTRASI